MFSRNLVKLEDFCVSENEIKLGGIHFVKLHNLNLLDICNYQLI